MKRELGKHMDKLNTFVSSMMPLCQQVEDLRGQFKSTEFQHRMDMGEMHEALRSFQSKQYPRDKRVGRNMWAEIVRGREQELKSLRIELGVDVEEEKPLAAELPEVAAEKKKPKKKKGKHGKKKPMKPHFTRECAKCRMMREQMLAGASTPKANCHSDHDKCIHVHNPKRRVSEKVVIKK